MVLSHEIISEIGESGINFTKALKYVFKGEINWAETSRQVIKAGIGSIFIVSLTSAFIGLAMSTQLATELSKNFGAEHLVGGLVTMAIVRELAPVLTAIVVAGRVGAAISAEIGSMKSSEQIDALKVMGIDPIKYLLVPRIIAAAVTSPLLTVIAAFVGILSGMVLTRLTVGLNYSVYLDSARLFIEERDVYIMMLKAAVFGVLISILATTTGLEVEGGAEAVGEAVTKTVVWCIILIFTSNYIITSLLYG